MVPTEAAAVAVLVILVAVVVVIVVVVVVAVVVVVVPLVVMLVCFVACNMGRHAIYQKWDIQRYHRRSRLHGSSGDFG